MRELHAGRIRVDLTRPQRRVLAAVVIGALGCLLLGFLAGYIHSPAGDGGEHVVPLPSLLPHDVAVHRALPVLEAYQHWGHYTESADSGNSASGDTDLALSFSLVGVQQLELPGEQEPYSRDRIALLLFIEGGPIAVERLASVPDANSIIRVEEGQALFDRVLVRDILVDAVTLTGLQTATADESKTWRLSIYADTP